MRITTSTLAAFLLLIAAAQPLLAQEGRPPEGRPAGENRAAAENKKPEQAAPALPAPVTKDARIALNGGELAYKTTVGTLTLRDNDGKPRAEMGFFAYTVDPGADRNRPVTFAFNGGPGAGSAFLNLGAVGPKVLPLGEGMALRPSAVPPLVDNAQTWLDFTDLVFLDPVGTGWSRAAEGVDPKTFWSVESDARSLAEAIRLYLTQNDRRGSPVFLLGESYGGFRGPLVANILRKDKGVGVSGLVLVSPVLDFAARSDNLASPMRWVTRLPTLAAVKLGTAGPVSRAALADAERYAAGDYLTDLIKGPRDKDAVTRMAARVSDLTGLDRAELEREAGHLDLDTIVANIRKRTGKVPSLYDADVLGLDPEPNSRRSRADDPVLDAIVPMLDAAMARYARNDLGYVTDRPYEVLNGEVNRRWEFGGGRNAPESVSDMQEILAIDPKLRVLVLHGYADLVTPYFESKLVLDQLPRIGADDRVRLEIVPGGHMFYTRPEARSLFKADAKAMYDAVLD